MTRSRIGLRASAVSGLATLVLCAHSSAGHAEEVSNAVEEVIVTARSIAQTEYLPTTVESVTADSIAKTTNVFTPEDTVKYMPNVLVRQRHIGDTQAPITTRTSGVGASARSLIYVDGMLISSLIGNNNTSASPKWGLVSPNAVARVDVLYGPFAAAYAGNSIGTVMAFTTRMPTQFEMSAEAQGAVQWFSKYGDKDQYGTGRFAADISDRIGKVAFRLSFNHLDNRGQPLTYATAAVPVASSTAGTAVTGAFADFNRTGAVIQVLGGTGIEHQVQNNASGRVTFDITPSLTAAYTFGLFVNDTDSTVNSYLRDAAGLPVYAGAVNIAGRAYTVANSAFSNGVYRFDETQLAQGLSLASHTDGVFDFELSGSYFDYIKSRQRTPSGALPGAFTGGAGSVASLDGTDWYVLDAKGIWKPRGETHIVTFGLHEDRFKIQNPRYALTDWIGGADGAVTTKSAGKTRTSAVWAQEAWKASPQVTLTLGGRYERWQAYDGANFSATPALNVAQPTLSRDAFSPKAVLAYEPSEDWRFKGSFGLAYRFPTVTELYQAITTGTTLSVPNPNLRPERAISSELSVDRNWSSGQVRVSVFDERLRDALLSQTAPLPVGSTTLASYVQNVDRAHSTGVEIVARQRDVFIPGLELSGWVTYVRTRIDQDTAFAAAVGKRLPQVPRWRGSAVATYAPTQAWAFTLAARYSDKSFGTIENSDYHSDTYQGFGAYFVMDAKVRYQINAHVVAEMGVNNLLNRDYLLFHPFPQRTVMAAFKYTY